MPLTENEVLQYITNTPASATAIAKKAGYAKGASIQDALDALVESGRVEKDDSGRFTVYYLSSDSVPATTPAATTTRVSNVDDADDLDDQEIDGYTVTPNCRNAAGQIGSRITLPDGRKTFVKEGSSLLVINDSPCYTVSTPEAVIKGIVDWTSKNNLRTFVVEQIGIGSIYSPTDVKMVSVINLKISAVNKAAR